MTLVRTTHLEVAGLETCNLLGVSDWVGDCGGEEVSLYVPLQGGVDSERGGALVTLVVPLRHPVTRTRLLLVVLEKFWVVWVCLVQPFMFLQTFPHGELSRAVGAGHHVAGGAARTRHLAGLLVPAGQAGELTGVADLEVGHHAAPPIELLVAGLAPLSPPACLLLYVQLWLGRESLYLLRVTLYQVNHQLLSQRENFITFLAAFNCGSFRLLAVVNLLITRTVFLFYLY